MNEYTASNGTTVSTEAEDELFVVDEDEVESLDLEPKWVFALREFFRTEEDERLGRWRWPDEPHFVVYPETDDSFGRRRVVVINERTTDKTTFTLAVATGQSDKHRAARAYFAAHPEPKPWRDAKPGEFWELTAKGAAERWWVDDKGRFRDTENGSIKMPRDNRIITAGRRIYPEVSP